MRNVIRIAAACLLLGLSSSAFAANAFVTRTANLRAGPDRDYPRIMQLHAGTAVSIVGCIDGYSWCDVYAFGQRGWVYARFLQYDYDHRRVLLPDYGARIGIPIVSFVLGAYWDSHYRARPWYRERDRWSHHSGHRPGPPHHAGPKPKPPISHKPPKPNPGHRPPAPKPPAHRPTPNPRPPVNRPKPPTRPLPAHSPARPKPATPARAPAKKPPPNKDRDKDRNGH